MEKYKYYLCIILWTFMPKTSFAVDFELTDLIRESREAQMKISQIQQNVEQTKKQFMENNNQVQVEYSAEEKLNPEEILNNEK